MAFTRKEKDGIAVLEVSGALSIMEVASLHKVMVECLESAKGLLVDLKQVAACDTAGLQLLYTARKSFEGAGKSFAIENPPDDIKNNMLRAGLDPNDIL